MSKNLTTEQKSTSIVGTGQIKATEIKPLQETPLAEEAKNEVQVLTPHSTPNIPKSLSDVLERLEQANLMKKSHERICDRLDKIKKFASSLDGGYLKAKIENGKGDELEYDNFSLIIDFINNSIKNGEQAKRQVEDELLLF